MNALIHKVCLFSFLLLPALLLAVRFLRPRWMPWWAIPLILALLGWVLVNATVHFYYESLNDLAKSYGDNVPPELMTRIANDGAKLAFALFFGWLYGLLYSLPFLALYFIAVWVRKGVRKHRLSRAAE